MRTVFWDADALNLIDQRRLPASLELVTIRTLSGTIEAIRNMTVRGAPAIGATAAFGLALAAQESHAKSIPNLLRDLDAAGRSLKASRPTAINLAWAVDRVLDKARTDFAASIPDELRSRVIEEAQKIAEEDIAVNKRMGEYGASLIEDGDVIIHHCNTGALAVVDWGTALGAIRTAHEQGKRVHVLVDETRPRLQGARLTAWELLQYGIAFDIITDNMSGYFLRSGKANKVFFGADRIALNGDVANKIGTYMLALAAFDNNIPAVCVAPSSTFDFVLKDGYGIPIEDRDPEEVLGLQYHGEPVVPDGATARNPAFDVTPARLISAIVTENGVCRPPFDINLHSMNGNAR